MKHTTLLTIIGVSTLALSIGGTTLHTFAQVPSTSYSISDNGIGYGQGITDTTLRARFELLARADIFHGMMHLVPTGVATVEQVGNKTVWKQSFQNPASIESYIAFFNATEDKAVPVSPEFWEVAKTKELGLPTSYPRKSSNISVASSDQPHILRTFQTFDSGYILRTETTVFNDGLDHRPALTQEPDMPSGDGQTTTETVAMLYSSLRSMHPLLGGDGAPDADIRAAFLAAHLGLADATYEPTGQVKETPQTLTQEFSNNDGKKMLLMLDPQYNKIYTLEPELYALLSHEELNALGAPRTELLPDSYGALIQEFSNGKVSYDAAANTKQIVATGHPFDHRIQPSEIGEWSTPHRGDSTLMLLRVQFSDLNYSAAPTNSFYEQTLNSDDNISFRSYWKFASNGEFRPKFVVRTVQAKRPLAAYLAEVPESDMEGKNSIERKIMKEIHESTTIDWEVADTNGKDGVPDGYVDGFFFMYDVTNKMARDAGLGFSMREHAWNTSYLGPNEVTSSSGKKLKTGPYCMVAAVTGMATYTHEFGHMLGMMDLYDSDGSSMALGHTSLMANSRNSLPNIEGESIISYDNLPQFLDPYSRIALGWAKVIEVEGRQDVTIHPNSQSNVVYKLGKGNEYFLVEARQKASFDRSLPDEGLAVYKINEDAFGNGEEWKPRIRLVTANGQYPMQNEEEMFFKTGALLPGPAQHKEGEAFVDQVFHLDTNTDDGRATGIHIENIDTTSDYPNVRVSLFNPGTNNQFADIQNGTSFARGTGDIDRNNVINEDDHTLLLEEALGGNRVLSELQNAYLALKSALADARSFRASLTPLAITDVTAQLITQNRIELKVRTNIASHITVVYGEKKDTMEATLAPDEVSKDHTVVLQNLKPRTTYYMNVSAETAWRESAHTDAANPASFTTLPLTAYGDILRSRYVDMDTDADVLNGINNLEACMSKLDTLLEMGYYPGKRVAIHFDANLSIPYELRDGKLYIQSAWAKNPDGLCTLEVDIELQKLLIQISLQDDNIFQDAPAAMKESLYMYFVVSALSTQEKMMPLIYRGTLYSNGKDLRDRYFKGLTMRLNAGEVTATADLIPDLLTARFIEDDRQYDSSIAELRYYMKEATLALPYTEAEKMDRFSILYTAAAGRDVSSYLTQLGFPVSPLAAQIGQQYVESYVGLWGKYIGGGALQESIAQAFNTRLVSTFDNGEPVLYYQADGLVETYKNVTYQKVWFMDFTQRPHTKLPLVAIYNPVVQQVFTLDQEIFVHLAERDQTALLGSILNNQQSGVDGKTYLYFTGTWAEYDKTTKEFTFHTY